jgi:flagellar biosynthesis anti-sigma factor FlgM
METYKTQQLRRAAKPGGSLNTDRVEISTEAKTFEQAKKLAAGIPEAREDRIAVVEKRLADGAINVPAAALAAKMLEQDI